MANTIETNVEGSSPKKALSRGQRRVVSRVGSYERGARVFIIAAVGLLGVLVGSLRGDSQTRNIRLKDPQSGIKLTQADNIRVCPTGTPLDGVLELPGRQVLGQYLKDGPGNSITSGEDIVVYLYPSNGGSPCMFGVRSFLADEIVTGREVRMVLQPGVGLVPTNYRTGKPVVPGQIIPDGFNIESVGN